MIKSILKENAISIGLNLVIAAVGGAFMFIYSERIAAYHTSVEQNRATISQAVIDIEKLNAKLGELKKDAPTDDESFADKLEEHDQKIQLLQHTLNKLHGGM